MRRLLIIAVILVLLASLTGCEWLFGRFPNGGDPQPGAVLFFDDFQDGYDPAWGFTRGNWEVVDGQLHTTSEPGSAYVTGGNSWTDYSVECQLSYSGNFYGHPSRRIVVRAADDLNKVVFGGFQGGESRVGFIVYVDGEIVVETESIPTLPDTCIVRIDVVGSTYSAFVDGIHVMTLEDHSNPSGTAGLGISAGEGWGPRGASGWFDDFLVTSLE